MNCEDIEMLMAEALGDELSPADRPAFEAHLVECDRCRREYESARQAVATMRALPGSKRVTVKREGNRLVIEDTRAAGFSPRGHPRRLKPAARAAGGIFRYAASVLIAFAAGYALHVGLMAVDASRRVELVTQGDEAPTVMLPATGDTLQIALASAHARNPARSDLAKCLVAMAHAKP